MTEDTVTICGAGEVGLAALHRAMLAAFSDYAVPMRLSFAQFEDLLAQRSFAPDLSCVALSPAGVAAFWLIGRRANEAYLICSGTLPAHRRKGLAEALGQRSETLLDKAGIKALRLEVITTNTGALAAYRKMGFVTVRTLQCYSLPAVQGGGASMPLVEEQDWRDVPAPCAGFMDWQPTWQNAADALAGLRVAPLCLVCRDGGDAVAYAVMDVASGTVFQLAVRADRRRSAFAQALLSGLSARAEAGTLRFINVDAGDPAFDAFLMRNGAVKTVQQFEMVKRLSR